MKKISLLIILISSLLLGSCSNGNSTNKDDYVTVIDLLDRNVDIKKDVEKVCITFNLEEYLAIGGSKANDKIVGWSFSYLKGRREDAYNAYTIAYPSLLEKNDIGYGENISIEAIISLSPDVIFASKSADYSYFESKLTLLEKAHIAIVFVDYHTDTIETITKSNALIGKILNEEERASEISKYYSNKVSPILEKAKSIKEEDRPKVYMEFSKGKDTYGNTWGKKMWGSLIEQVGGNNIAYNVSDANSFYMAKEAIISENPDIIIFTGALQNGLSDNIVLGYNQDDTLAKINLESYLSRDGWSNLSAIKNRQLYALYHDLSRHIFDFAGIMYLAKIIQPDLFKDLDPLADLKEFFHLYMPLELNGTFFVSL